MEENKNISKSIGIVRGNVLRASIALEVSNQETVDGQVITHRQELIPLDGKVRVVLRDGGSKYTYDVTATGNVAEIEDLGTLKAGIYDIEVLCRNSNNEPMRYMARDVIIVNEATADAGIEPGVEFDAQTVQLEAAVFQAAGGGSSTEQVQSDWNENNQDNPAYIRNKPTIPVVPTRVSAFDNDAGYLTGHQDISGKVDKEAGKGLSSNDYTTEEKQKLAGLSNYDDSRVLDSIRSLQAAIDALTGVDDTTAAIDTMQEVINFLSGVTDDETLAGKLTELRTLIGNKANSADVNNALRGKADIVDYLSYQSMVAAAAGGRVNHGTIGYDQDKEVFYIFESANANWIRLGKEPLFKQYTDKSAMDADSGAVTGLIGFDGDEEVFYIKDSANNEWRRIDNVQADWSESDPNSGAYIRNKPTIPAVPVIVEVAASGVVTQALEPNKFYKFTGSLTQLDITLTAGTAGMNVYAGKFTADAGGCTFGYPSAVVAATSVPSIEGGKTYEFNIVDNVLMMVEV